MPGDEDALASLAEFRAPRGTVSEERSGAEIFVRGRVQGVGFREFCVRAAERLGIVGYATNLRDGRVRIVAEGTRTALDAFVREVERGPRLARVEQATVSWRSPSEPFTTFGIRYTGDDA